MAAQAPRAQWLACAARRRQLAIGGPRQRAPCPSGRPRSRFHPPSPFFPATALLRTAPHERAPRSLRHRRLRRPNWPTVSHHRPSPRAPRSAFFSDTPCSPLCRHSSQVGADFVHPPPLAMAPPRARLPTGVAPRCSSRSTLVKNASIYFLRTRCSSSRARAWSATTTGRSPSGRDAAVTGASVLPPRHRSEQPWAAGRAGPPARFHSPARARLWAEPDRAVCPVLCWPVFKKMIPVFFSFIN
jgi:hypothetical protein